jgi:hypothetical protein
MRLFEVGFMMFPCLKLALLILWWFEVGFMFFLRLFEDVIIHLKEN